MIEFRRIYSAAAAARNSLQEAARCSSGLVATDSCHWYLKLAGGSVQACQHQKPPAYALLPSSIICSFIKRFQQMHDASGNKESQISRNWRKAIGSFMNHQRCASPSFWLSLSTFARLLSIPFKFAQHRGTGRSMDHLVGFDAANGSSCSCSAVVRLDH